MTDWITCSGIVAQVRRAKAECSSPDVSGQASRRPSGSTSFRPGSCPIEGGSNETAGIGRCGGTLNPLNYFLPRSNEVRTKAITANFIGGSSEFQFSMITNKSESGTNHGCAGGCAFFKSMVFPAFAPCSCSLPSWLLRVRVPSPAFLAPVSTFKQIPVSSMIVPPLGPSGTPFGSVSMAQAPWHCLMLQRSLLNY